MGMRGSECATILRLCIAIKTADYGNHENDFLKQEVRSFIENSDCQSQYCNHSKKPSII